MGEFTIYDWGNGAAAEAYNRIFDKFGSLSPTLSKGEGVCLDETFSNFFEVRFPSAGGD